MKKQILIGIVVIFMTTCALLGINNSDKTLGGSRDVTQERVIFSGQQGLASVTYDGSTDEILAESAHSLVVGDVVRFNTSSAAFGGADAPGFSEKTNYFVVTATTSAAFEVSTTKGGTVLDIATAASAGGGEYFTEEFTDVGKKIDVSEFRHITITIDAEEAPSASLFLVGAIQEAPVFYATRSVSNRWENIAIYDIQDASLIPGDTGLTFTGGDDHRMFTANVDELAWIMLKSADYASGSFNISIKAAN
jgi:hypothetical protein